MEYLVIYINPKHGREALIRAYLDESECDRFINDHKDFVKAIRASVGQIVFTTDCIESKRIKNCHEIKYYK